MYQHLGTQVTVLQRSPRIVPEEEPEISEYLNQYLKEDGVEKSMPARTSSQPNSETGGRSWSLGIGDRKRTIEADELLLATGRTPTPRGLTSRRRGVEVKQDQGVKVDSEMHRPRQTSSRRAT